MIPGRSSLIFRPSRDECISCASLWSLVCGVLVCMQPAHKYIGQVGTQNLMNKGALEYFGRLVTMNLREKRVR